MVIKSYSTVRKRKLMSSSVRKVGKYSCRNLRKNFLHDYSSAYNSGEKVFSKIPTDLKPFLKTSYDIEFQKYRGKLKIEQIGSRKDKHV